MKRHKSTAPDHEYCEKCDLDCETEDQLLIHKIKSNKHIVCPVCGIEFGSEGGRDRHIRLVSLTHLIFHPRERERERVCVCYDDLTHLPMLLL